MTTVDKETYEAIREQLEAALANTDDEAVRHSVRNALQMLVGEREAADDGD